LAFTFDPANFLLNDHDPLSNLAACGQRLAYVQARDGHTATPSGGAKEFPVGAGDVEWMAFAATLEALSYRGFVTVDREDGTERTKDISTGVGVLRRFLPIDSQIR
jgi:sugar phosphate isomerase/epimerase